MISRQLLFRASRLARRSYATDTSSTPPMLLKLRTDLKTAMRAKETPRLTVLRALLASTLNASKTSTPITTDLALRALILKHVSASQAAISDFQKASREDLVRKEEDQIKILEEYAGGVEMMGVGEVREVVVGLVETMKTEAEGGKKLSIGDVSRRVFDKDVLGERNVERGEVAKIVREVLAGSS
ncbi:hypothetical protein HYALB_00001467 [Hymenoscyphus albidus]|uniref:Altered inheritance of mitochondria protein 41 n=1 Tax=Hymenoscyphus albidus TaxID=595503 RepID=A0A9N9L9Y6_9HELO|nr:hypothetical protein HYALB_00001467 [Hymenoscyphus albidus]